MRELLRRSGSCVLLLLIMLGGGVVLWVGVSAGVALVVFGAWFLLFTGSSPVPTGLGF